MNLGLIGFGNIARVLLPLLEDEPVQRLTVLVRPGRRSAVSAELEGSGAAGGYAVVETLDDFLSEAPDVVVECAGQAALASLVIPVLAAGRTVIAASVGALADRSLHQELQATAQASGGRLILPAGAIGGIDLLAALAPAGSLKVVYEGRKPPAAWAGTQAEREIDLNGVTQATPFYNGDAGDAARRYPKNANVAATLALAGGGFANTQVTLIADPSVRGNIHRYSVQSPVGRFSVEIENEVSSGNAKTSVATVYSILREINRVRRAVVI